jgi:ATP-dependent RNA helicase RhlE
LQFHQLGLTPALVQALDRAGYKTPTPVQQQAIGPALAGRDVLGCAQTGTGKTAAFALPILQRLGARAPGPGVRPVRALILTPTRELAAQVADSFRTYGHFMRLPTAVIFGGVPERPQIDALRRGVDIVVATPGRLLDLMNQGHARLGSVEVLVLDEADRMLDMGFLPDMRRIIARVPTKRQTLLFSATLPREIRDLAHGLLVNPVSVSVAAESAAADTVEQCVYFVEREGKQALLARLLDESAVTRALVFTRTKHRADRVARALTKAGTHAEAIHGNKSQGQRTRALRNFETGETRVLVASDIASRGLDITDVSHVFNFDLPNEPETYVHRIGRTGRAGASGLAVSFCDHEERAHLRTIERLIGRRIPVAGGTRDEAPAPSRPASGRTRPQSPWQPPPRQQPQRQKSSRRLHAHREDERRPGGPWRQPRNR